MKSRRSEFKLIDRSFKDTILLIPGWATDHRIFGSLDLDFNYLVPTRLSLSDFEEALLTRLKKESLDKISVLGWSMGGFLAADLASKCPQMVKDLTLVGMRKRYDEDGIKKIKGYLGTNKNGYLYKFYHECFSPEEKEALSVFKRGLMKDYLKEFAADELLTGLDYLTKAELKAEVFKKVKTRLIHGDSDRIAPIEELIGMEGIVVLKGAGHAPFLRNDFKKVFYG